MVSKFKIKFYMLILKVTIRSNAITIKIKVIILKCSNPVYH